MLRDVCDRCGKVLDGEPHVNREYPDVTLLMDDEVVVMYECLCPNCRGKLMSAVRNLGDVPKRTDAKEVPKAESQKIDAAPAEESVEKPKAEPLQKVDPDSLPNQVTKQFPINLPERPRG